MAVTQNTTVGTEVNRAAVARSIRTIIRTIPRDVQYGIIALGLLQGRLLETRDPIRIENTRQAIDKWKKRVENRRPGASAFASDTELVAELIRRHNRRCESRKPASWPGGDRIPMNREQALEQGWEFAGRERMIREEEFQGFYEVDLRKTVGPVRLALTLPYRVTLTYGRPHGPRVTQRRRAVSR